MTPEEMRVAILEWLGWGDLRTGSDGKLYGYRVAQPSEERREAPPLTLDFMHEAEKALTINQVRSYLNHLKSCVNADNERMAFDWVLCHATKEHRAEAFCRTLWPERFK